MKKKLKIFLIVLGILAAIIAGITVWQWQNIKAVIYFLNYSQEDLDEMYESNQKTLDEALEGFSTAKPRDLTEEEKNALKNNIITEEEAIDISLGKTTLEEVKKSKNLQGENGETETSPEKSTAGETKPGQQGNNPQNQSDKKIGTEENDNISKLIAKLYVLKSSYIGRLDGLEAEGLAEYSKTPKEQRTSAWRGSMISKYSARISAWEAECDAAVEGIISEIRRELNKNGGDTSIIQTIRSTYQNEKQIKKASYLNKYMK